MTTYLIISSALLFGYLCYKAGYSRGIEQGRHYGFMIGRRYEQAEKQITKQKAFEFKHYQTN